MMTIEKLNEANALHERIEKAKEIKDILDNAEVGIAFNIPSSNHPVTDPVLREKISEAVATYIEKLEYDFRWL